MTDSPGPPHPLARVLSLVRTGPLSIVLRFVDQAYRKTRGAPLWRLCAVTPQLAVGGQHYRGGYAAMQAYGITAVVNLRESRFNDEQAGIGGDRHLHLATIDNTPPSREDLVRGVQFISDEIATGGKVYVHCGVGVGRAPTLAAAYLISTGLTPDDALRGIRAVRPFVHLTASQRAVLDEFARLWPELTPQASCQN